MVREALQGAQGDQVAKTIESFAPARLRTDQPKPFPIAKTVRLHSQNAPNFSSRISLGQAGKTPEKRFREDYAPFVNGCVDGFA